MRWIPLSEIVENNGKTVRENNMEIKHQIPLGTLVEVIGLEPDSDYYGIRLYVIQHHRDCDGTPLYALGPKGCNPHNLFFPSLFAGGIAHGLPERCLRVV
jgi:hypothetical protein